MKPSPRDSAATRKLLKLLNDKATGRLEVGAGGSTLSVYVLHGEVVAAVSVEDERQLLHLLRLRGDVPEVDIARMELAVDDGQSVFGDLLAANPSSLDELLSQRFRQNLCDYVASLEKPTYAPQKGVFVDNVQMGHESRPLVEACCAFATKAQRVDPDQLLVRGTAEPRTETVAGVAAVLTDEPQSVYALTLRIPMEPTAARCLLIDMVTEGVAVVPGAEVQPTPESTQRIEASAPPEPPDAPPAAAAPPDPQRPVAPRDVPPTTLVPDDDDDLESEDGIVEHLDDWPEPEAPSALDSDLPPEGELEGDVLPQSEANEPAEDHPAAESQGNQDENQGNEGALEGTADTSDDDGAEAVDDVELGETEDAEERHPNPDDIDLGSAESSADPDSANSGAPRSLADWLADATHVDDDELDFFSDHDHDRGGSAEGAFSTETHNLDTVDVTNFDEDEILEAEEAPSAPKYSAPVLGEEAAEAKIAVAIDMLRKIVAAFDEAEGSGAGQAAMQLLVDGAPPKFVPLLTGLTVSNDGSLATGRVLANLYARPATEHRKLINDGMLNLMERALSKAADELPDELFDSVYEGVAGYKQRLGL